MSSTKFTHRDLLDNLTYARNSDHCVGHPNWNSKYLLTLSQCVQGTSSSDMSRGYIRRRKTECFCDMCSKKIGEFHRPACIFNGLVGNLNDLTETEEDESRFLAIPPCIIM